MHITTSSPKGTRLPDLTVTAELADLQVIALPVAGGFDFWFISTLPFFEHELDSVALAVTGHQACAILEELRLEQPAHVSDARRAAKRLAGLKRIRSEDW